MPIRHDSMQMRHNVAALVSLHVPVWEGNLEASEHMPCHKASVDDFYILDALHKHSSAKSLIRRGFLRLA